MRTLEHRFLHIPQEVRRGRAWLASLLPLFEGALATEAVVPEDAFCATTISARSCSPSSVGRPRW